MAVVHKAEGRLRRLFRAQTTLMRYLTPQRLITLRLGVACFRLLMFRTSYTLKIDICKVCQTFQTFSHLSLLLFALFIGPVEVKPV